MVVSPSIMAKAEIQMGIRLKPALFDRLEREAERRGITKGMLIGEALDKYLPPLPAE